MSPALQLLRARVPASRLEIRVHRALLALPADQQDALSYEKIEELAREQGADESTARVIALSYFCPHAISARNP